MHISLYGCETKKEASRIQVLFYLMVRLQANEGDPALSIRRIEMDPPLIRVGQHGKPDVTVHWHVMTDNVLVTRQPDVLETALRLFAACPWPLSLWIAWAVFIWNCLTGKRRIDPKAVER